MVQPGVRQKHAEARVGKACKASRPKDWPESMAGRLGIATHAGTLYTVRIVSSPTSDNGTCRKGAVFLEESHRYHTDITYFWCLTVKMGNKLTTVSLTTITNHFCKFV